jgi:DNA helicase IV
MSSSSQPQDILPELGEENILFVTKTETAEQLLGFLVVLCL